MQAKFIEDFKNNTELYEFSPIRDSNGLLFQSHLMGHEIVGANYYLIRKNMDSFMISYIKRGHTHFMVQNETLIADTGFFIFHDCEIPHVSWVDMPDNAEGISAEFYYLHLYPTDALKKLHDSITEGVSVFNIGNDVGFIDLVNTLLKDYREGNYDEYKESVLIYEFLLRFEKAAKNSKQIKTSLPEEIKQTIKYIVNNYKEKITIADCAFLVNLAPNYLENLFSKYMSMPILQYLAQFRFQKAGYLLLNTDMRISEVAKEVGLYDSQALIRLFSKKVNMTPLNYRIKNKK